MASMAETLDLGPGDTGLCKPCVEGVCHWDEQGRDWPWNVLRPECGCARHRVSAYARSFCLAEAPEGRFPFATVCRRPEGHIHPPHCDTWREAIW